MSLQQLTLLKFQMLAVLMLSLKALVSLPELSPVKEQSQEHQDPKLQQQQALRA
jgi:hypothetical protein